MALDYGHQYADDELKKLEKKIAKEYTTASKEMQKKADNYFEKFKKQDADMVEQLNSGKITKDEYLKWRQNKMLTGDRYNHMVDELSQDLTNANRIAMGMIDPTIKDVYAENYNYGGYEVARGLNQNISWDLVDHDTVEHLIRDNPKLLPKPRVDIPKDLRWNQQKLRSALTQAILQGEAIPDIAKRLQSVTDMSGAAAIRNARTATTGAENAGRQQSYDDAKEELGIEMGKQWIATLDDRTRDSHRELDGEIVGSDEKFSNDLLFPADPMGEPEEVYNCRCTMTGVLKGHNYKMDNRASKLGDMTYEEWKYGQAEPEPQDDDRQVVNGTDISDTWHRRPDEFDFEIEDVINAQGFDGLPKVVDSEEFDKCVKESNIIMQRGYTAPDAETLKLYQNELYNGKWYVDCSSGGHVFGRGMYADGRFGETVNDAMSTVMKSYGAGVEQGTGMIETFTLTKDAKILNYRDIDRLRQEYGQKSIDNMFNLKDVPDGERFFIYSQAGFTNTEETMKAMNWVSENSGDVQKIYEKYLIPKGEEIGKLRNSAYSMDEGVLATLNGYDAINCDNIDEHTEDGYFVILNRTKCIFKKGGGL